MLRSPLSLHLLFNLLIMMPSLPLCTLPPPLRLDTSTQMGQSTITLVAMLLFLRPLILLFLPPSLVLMMAQTSLPCYWRHWPSSMLSLSAHPIPPSLSTLTHETAYIHTQNLPLSLIYIILVHDKNTSILNYGACYTLFSPLTLLLLTLSG